jgi:hypothetical protein
MTDIKPGQTWIYLGAQGLNSLCSRDLIATATSSARHYQKTSCEWLVFTPWSPVRMSRIRFFTDFAP